MFDLKYAPYELLNKKVKSFDFDTQDPEQLEIEMTKVMKQHRGVGIAANQVGLDSRVFVVGSDQISGFLKPQAFFNPVILRVSKEENLHVEGCLSFPGYWLKVKRPIWAEVAYQDKKGATIEAQVDGYLAKIFQHEYDHLEGICFVDRVSKLKLEMATKRLEKQNRKKG